MKRYLFIPLLLMFLCFPVTTFAENNVTIGIKTQSSVVMPGDEIVYSVLITNAEDIAKMQFTFNYDSSALTYVKRSFGTVLSKAALKNVRHVKEQSKLGFTATLNSPFTGEGVLCEFTFTVNSDAPVGVIDCYINNTKFGKVDEVSSEAVYDKMEDSKVSVGSKLINECGIIKIENDVLTAEIINPENTVILVSFYDKTNNTTKIIKSVIVDVDDIINGVVSVKVPECGNVINYAKIMFLHDFDDIVPLSCGGDIQF